MPARSPLPTNIARFRDADRFAACCRACPGHGGGPPFAFDVEEYIGGYATLCWSPPALLPPFPAD